MLIASGGRDLMPQYFVHEGYHTWMLAPSAGGEILLKWLTNKLAAKTNGTKAQATVKMYCHTLIKDKTNQNETPNFLLIPTYWQMGNQLQPRATNNEPSKFWHYSSFVKGKTIQNNHENSNSLLSLTYLLVARRP